MVVAATLGGWIAGAALARDAALLASGLVLIDLPLRVDAAAAAHVDERLHEAGLLAPGRRNGMYDCATRSIRAKWRHASRMSPRQPCFRPSMLAERLPNPCRRRKQ